MFLIFYLLSIGSAVILDDQIVFESIDSVFCKLLKYCEQFLKKYWEVEPRKEIGYFLNFCVKFFHISHLKAPKWTN